MEEMELLNLPVPYLLLLAQQLVVHEERRPVHVFALSATSLATTHVPVKQRTKND